MDKEYYIYKEFELYLTNIANDSTNYITNRVINQIIWYDKKSIDKQKQYKKYSIISIVFTALIPILTLLTGYRFGAFANILIAILGSASSAILSISSLCEFQKLWVQYRSTCEILKSILHRYYMGVGEFCSDTPQENLQLLCTMCEEYLTKEFHIWSNTCNEKEKEK